MAIHSIVEGLLNTATQSEAALTELIERGLPIEGVAELRDQGLTFTEVGEIVIPARTLKHRKARRERLSTEESERLLRVSRVLSLADQVFGDHGKAMQWLREPDPRWNDRSGLMMLRTETGGRVVENTLTQIREGMFP